MKKKLITSLSIMMSAAMLMACSSTTTVTETDADGNTTTTVTDNNTGETTTTQSTTYTATLTIANVCGVDAYEMYFSPSGEDSWGDELLGDQAPLMDGEKITFENAFTYDDDNMVWDLELVDSEGTECEFDGIDMSAADDPSNIYITITLEGDTYTAYLGDATGDAAESGDTISATLTIVNDCDVDAYEMYITSASQDDWGEELLGSDAPLMDDEQITFQFTYASDDTVWDMLLVDSEGTECSFTGIDVSQATDPTNITIQVIEEDDAYTAYIL